MYENYGNTSLGGLPADYGKAATEGVVGATQELPSPQAGSGQYAGKVGDWLAEKQAQKGESLTPEEAAARGSAVGAGAAGFVKETLPTFLELFGPQVEEQPLLPEDADLPATSDLTYPQREFPWLPVIGVVSTLLIGRWAVNKWGN